MPNDIHHISVNVTLIWIHSAQGSIYLTTGKLPAHEVVTVTGALRDKQAYLGDILGSVLDYHNKVSLTIK